MELQRELEQLVTAVAAALAEARTCAPIAASSAAKAAASLPAISTSEGSVEYVDESSSEECVVNGIGVFLRKVCVVSESANGNDGDLRISNGGIIHLEGGMGCHGGGGGYINEGGKVGLGEGGMQDYSDGDCHNEDMIKSKSNCDRARWQSAEELRKFWEAGGGFQDIIDGEFTAGVSFQSVHRACILAAGALLDPQVGDWRRS